MKKLFICLCVLTLAACTDGGEIYDSKKHKKSDFSAEKTVGLLAATAILAAAANNNYYGGSTTDYDWDWDYQPANGQWVCRGIQTGQYAELENCAYDMMNDDRWPG